MDHEEYLKRVRSYIKTPTKDMEKQLADFCGLCSYVSGQYDQDEGFIELRKHCEELEKGRKETNRIFYMALPPSVFTVVSQHLKRNAYPKSGVARVIVRIQPHSRASHCSRSNRRSRSLSERIWPRRGSYRSHWSQIGRRKRSSVSTTILERRW